jgi:hypothetical protein
MAPGRSPWPFSTPISRNKRGKSPASTAKAIFGATFIAVRKAPATFDRQLGAEDRTAAPALFNPRTAVKRWKEEIMRIMMRIRIPVEKGNEAVADGSMPKIIKNLVDQLKPESAYFHLEDGKRAGTIVFEESDVARLTAINEPLFASLNAEIELQPVLTLADLLKKL